MRITDRQLLIASVGISALLLLKHLLVPLNPDNDTYHAMAWQLYKYGELPYLGSWDQNFPGVVYIHWLSIALFGNTALGFRALDALFHLANVFLLFAITRRLFDARAAALTGILYILYYTHDSFWLAGQRDGFAVTFVLLALWVHYQKWEHRTITSGVFLGCATIIRPTFALFGLAILFLEQAPVSGRIRQALQLSGGALAMWIVHFIPYALTHNGLREYYLATIRFTADLYGGHALPWSNLLLWNRAQKIYFTILFVGAVVLLMQRRSLLPEKQQIRRSLLLMLGASTLPVLIMRKFSIYHFDPVFTLLTPLCAYLLIETALAFKRYRYVAFVMLVGIVAIRMFPRHVVKDYFKGPSGGRLEYVYNRIDHDSLYGELAERELAAYIKQHTSPLDKIEMASIWPGVSWMAERQRASRFTTWYALAMTQHGKQTAYQQQWQQEYVRSIREERPRYLIVARGPRSFLLAPENEPRAMFFRIAGMSELVRGHYDPDTVIRGYDVYRLKASGR